MQEAKLYLIFEYLTMDLKKYMDTNIPKDGQMDPKLTKSYLYQVMQKLLSDLIIYLFVFMCSAAARNPVLPPAASAPPRHEASEPAH